MTDTFEFTLNNPLTEEQWDQITDVDMERTNSVTFHTKHGREVKFVKVTLCKDCKHSLHNQFTGDWYCWLYNIARKVESDGFCYKAERKEE